MTPKVPSAVYLIPHHKMPKLKTQHAQHPSEIKAGAFYSNGKLGNAWSVRQIIDQSPNTKQHKDLVIFKTSVADSMDVLPEFWQWAA